MERRRSWASAGRLPPNLACRFTLAEQAVLAVIAVEVIRTGACRLALEHIAALAGVCRKTVKNALREAYGLKLVRIEERRLTGWRNDTNVVTIASPEWLSWLRLRRRGEGVKPYPPRIPGKKKEGAARPQKATEFNEEACGEARRGGNLARAL